MTQENTREIRSIPACTGEPQQAHYQTVGYAVYPRVYGGTAAATAWDQCQEGLSPRVRGNPRPMNPAWARDRSIPACTGEPTDNPESAAVTAVYPRVYGGT